MTQEERAKVATLLFKIRGKQTGSFLCKGELSVFVYDVLELFFPQVKANAIENEAILSNKLELLGGNFDKLMACISSEFSNDKERRAKLATIFFQKLPSIAEDLFKDAELIYSGDPAANSIDEVILCYPGFFAIAIYRLAHEMVVLEIPLIPRMLSEFAHEKTGIDIHPSAKIAAPFFIDHGTGIVIGETTKVGSNVKIYQGVTLGALSVNRGLRKKQRHPTIESGSILYANATILGGNTIIGKNSIIGGNVWITESVPANSQVYNKSEYTLIPLAD